MNTNKIETMGGAVNVTVHKNVLKNDGSTYAKVKRATAENSRWSAKARTGRA